MAMRNVLVTGANKGIGEAIVRKILTERTDVFVLLGSRCQDRGTNTKTKILEDIPQARGRLEVVVIDVSNDESVNNASSHVAATYKNLYGLVNNAGLGSSSASYKDIIDVNYRGVKRAFEAFRPLLASGGRVVNVTSAAGPMFVNQMPAGTLRGELTSKNVTVEQLENITSEFIKTKDAGVENDVVFGDTSKVYYFSKALANAYTIIAARENPELVVNACTPGYIATDMTRSHWESQGKSPEEIGAKPVECGAYAPCSLLFEVEGSGRYYGSDAVRSPLDKYRGPGEPEYVSDAE